jgi:hypothetical protein
MRISRLDGSKDGIVNWRGVNHARIFLLDGLKDILHDLKGVRGDVVSTRKVL